MGVFTLFPTDADGYPVVGPEPFSIEPDYTELRDMRPGNDGGITSVAGLVTFEGSVGPLPGDYNGDDIVDAADYTVWRDSLGRSDLLPYSGADGSGDGIVGPEDYDVWKSHYGEPGGSGSGAIANTAVPEPSALALLLVGLLAAYARRCQTETGTSLILANRNQ